MHVFSDISFNGYKTWCIYHKLLSFQNNFLNMRNMKYHRRLQNEG